MQISIRVPSPNHTPSSGTLSAGVTYYRKVQAFNSSTNPRTDGHFSTVSSFTTQPAPTPPLISSVVPTTYPASRNNQTMTITGSGFQNGATLLLNPPTGPDIPSNASKLTFVNSGQLIYQFNNANDVGPWTVQVINPGGHASNTVSFTVR